MINIDILLSPTDLPQRNVSAIILHYMLHDEPTCVTLSREVFKPHGLTGWDIFAVFPWFVFTLT